MRCAMAAVVLVLASCGGADAPPEHGSTADGPRGERAPDEPGETVSTGGHEDVIGRSEGSLRESDADARPELPARREPALFESRTTPQSRYVAVVRREMRLHHFLPITECLGALLCEVDDLHATIELVVEIDGSVSVLRVVAEAHEAPIRACVERQLSGSSFPAPPERIGIRYPFRPEVGSGC